MDVTLVTVRNSQGTLRMPRLLMKMWNMVKMVRVWELW
jgi:hypothetical protein